ncbi:MAG: hypothetical protein VX871_03345, partial [Pseudomonadota bacterium]|nr:hypothetical protein [Pseudomonadota bacterium]
AELWHDIVHTMDAHSFADTGGTWIRTHATAHERRGKEMDQIVEMARAAGLDLKLPSAAGAVFRASARARLARNFSANPVDMHAVIAALEKTGKARKPAGRKTTPARRTSKRS